MIVLEVIPHLRFPHMHDDDMLVRCFCCSAVRSLDELSICRICLAGRCGRLDSNCEGRCACDVVADVEAASVTVA